MALGLMMFLPFLVGAVTVLQGGLNKQLLSQYDLLEITLLNTAITLFAAIIVFFVWNQFEPIKLRLNYPDFRFWFIIPGICGLMVVLGIPFGINKLGATKLFVGIVAAQLIGGILWDSRVEAMSIGWNRILGACLALGGVLMTYIKIKQ